jgi:hypothetical protein
MYNEKAIPENMSERKPGYSISSFAELEIVLSIIKQ